MGARTDAAATARLSVTGCRRLRRVGRAAAIIGLSLYAEQAEAATFIRYTLAGTGTVTTYQTAPTNMVSAVTSDITLSFLVDVDQYPTSSSSGLSPPNLSTTTATGSSTSLMASGSDNSNNRDVTSFSANAIFTGTGSGFATALNSSSATGSFRITQSIGDFTGVRTILYSASITSISLSPASGYQTYIFSAVASLSTAPEPASWATMILGLGAVGGAMRCRRRPAVRVTS